jgi:hypothetical protein
VVPEATDTLMELFRDNRRLLDSLTDDQIFFFILFLQEKGRDPSFIKFLSVLCSCQGVALPKNQNFILQKLVEERPDLLIPLMMDDEKVFVQSSDGDKWVPLGKYVGSVDHSRLQYFALSIELFSNLCMGGNSRAISVISFPVFFFLCPSLAVLSSAARAHLCSSNRLTTPYISKLVPYELVQSVIRANDVTPHLRASFCDLMLNISSFSSKLIYLFIYIYFDTFALVCTKQTTKTGQFRELHASLDRPQSWSAFHYHSYYYYYHYYPYHYYLCHTYSG